MMGKSWNEAKHASNGIETMIAITGIVPAKAIARTVLIHKSKQAREIAPYNGGRTIIHDVSGSSDLDVPGTGDSFAITRGCSL